MNNVHAFHLSPVDGIGPHDWILQVFSAHCNYDQGNADLLYLDARVDEQQPKDLQTPSKEVDATFILQGAVFVAYGKAETPYNDQVACKRRI